MNPTRKLAGGIALTLTLTGIQQATADAINPVLDDRFTFKLGALQQKVKGDIIVNRPPLIETPVDVEVLGAEDNAINVWAEFNWRFSEKWSLNAMFNRYDESGGRSIEDSFNFDGVEYPVGATISTGLKADAYIMNVSYSFYETDKAEFGAGLGLHAFDLEAKIEASIFVGDAEESIAGTSEDLIAPVPNLRLYGIYAFTPKASLRGDFGWLSMTYGDWDGSYYYASASAEYRFTQRFGAGLGYQFTNIEVEYENGANTTEFDVKFNGAQLYLTYSF